MAKARGQRVTPASDSPEIPAPVPIEPSYEAWDSSGVEYTGRQLVLLREDSSSADVKALAASCGIKSIARASDFEASAIDFERTKDAEAIVFDELKVMVIDADPDKMASFSSVSASNPNVEATEPERMNHHFGEMELSGAAADYLRGYRDAVNELANRLLSGGDKIDAAEAAIAATFADDAQFTWGLKAVRANTSRFAGQGIRVAVLDTGFDFQHPDFVGRSIQQKSFVSGQTAQDGHGHGTHCIGTACGPKSAPPRRYGCAFGTSIYVGKVLSNQGSGADQGIIAGINWAMSNGCRIVSMSLGSRTAPGELPSQIYETLAQRALAGNTLIIAAAGNDSSRPGAIVPVSRPANCPSIMAVAAVDSNLRVASFSNGGINPQGGGVDIAGPGVGVFSAAPMSRRYQSMSGTSMATPHVAGVAALWLQARPTLSAQGLWQALIANAMRLSLPARDVGAGLVQAPQ